MQATSHDHRRHLATATAPSPRSGPRDRWSSYAIATIMGASTWRRSSSRRSSRQVWVLAPTSTSRSAVRIGRHRLCSTEWPEGRADRVKAARAA